jgi:uncharacterized protein (DUF58 family)
MFFVAVVFFVVGRLYRWEELTVVSATVFIALLVSLAFTFGRSELAVEVEVKPQRVRAGQRSAALLTVTNPMTGRMLPVRMELTVGDGIAEFGVPSLAGQASHEEVFVLPTLRRAVLPVGPATSVRSDPLGLLRRVQTWTEPVPLFVHPATVSLASLGTGLMRDLEGQATDQVSQADIAFHTMREYETGDDRRFIHWLTTARAGKLMVRQFIDTRRSHVAVLVDGSASSYADSEEFETAVSAAASLGVRVILDEQDISMVVAGERIPTGSGNAMLDSLCTVDTRSGRNSLGAEVEQLFRFATGLSVAIMITGSEVSIPQLRAATVRFPSDVRVLGMRVDHSATTGLQPIGSHRLLTLSQLEDLPQLLWAALS